MKFGQVLELIGSNDLTNFGSLGALVGSHGAPKEQNFKVYLLPHFLTNLNETWLILKMLPSRIKLSNRILNFFTGPELRARKVYANIGLALSM